MKTCHNCACDPVCDHNWNGWETCGNWIQKPEKPPTNADRIRAMSDEEMETELLPLFEELCEDGIPSTDYMRFWLQQPAEEDT